MPIWSSLGVDEHGHILGGGTCAICCGKATKGWLMCRTHWAQVPYSKKAAVNMAVDKWKAGVATLAELRAAQMEAIDSV